MQEKNLHQISVTMLFIRKFLESSIKLTDDEWRSFSQDWVKETFPKKTIILNEGKTENFLSFIEEGIVRFYMPKEDGTELSFVFAFDGWFMSAYESFLTQTPCEYTVETLTETTLWRLSFANLQKMYANTTIGNKIGRLASEQLFLMKTKRELSLLKDSAEQRYLDIVNQQPHLIQNIPLQYLASYIGITPQALSRIRGRIS